jgi:hypothetical protein
MAELQRVEINEKTPGEIEPEEVTEDVPESAEDAGNGDSNEDTAADTERPEWLPEKFDNAEDMAKAYGELEKKMGGDKAEETDEETAETEPTQSNDLIVEASKEFFEKGELGDATYEALAKLGLNRELVDSYAAGQASLMDNQQVAIKGEAGTDYDAMTEWAGQNLTDEEMDAYNEVVTVGTVDHAKLAVSGLHARYRSSTGSTAPKLSMGSTTGSGNIPFQSMQEVTRAMNDPLYKSGDKAYHAEIDRRLAVSNI